jgi:hypothetical protein
MNLFSAPMRAEMKRAFPPLQWFLLPVIIICALHLGTYCLSHYIISPHIGRFRENQVIYFCLSFLRNFPLSILFLIWLCWHLVRHELHDNHLDGELPSGSCDSATLFKLRCFVQGLALTLVFYAALLSTLPITLWRILQFDQVSGEYLMFIVVDRVLGLISGIFLSYGSLLLAYALCLRFPRTLTSRFSIILLVAVIAMLQVIVETTSTGLLHRFYPIPPFLHPRFIYGQIFRCMLNVAMACPILWLLYLYVAPRFKKTFYGDEDMKHSGNLAL